MATLTDFLPGLCAQDTKKKLTVGSEILSYLSNCENSLECDDLGAFVDGIVSWLSSSNFKIALNGLEVLVLFVDRMKGDFRPYMTTVLPAVMDRLGDNKDQVRELAQSVLDNVMTSVAQPQAVFDKLMPAFTHKNGRVREEIMICLQSVLNKHGIQTLSLSKFVPLLAKLLGDPTASVRDMAITTLSEIYRHVGERVRLDLSKKCNIPPAKLQVLFAKFDEIRDSGQLLPSANSAQGVGQDSGVGDDETDRMPMLTKSTAKRVMTAPPTKRAVFATPKPPSSVAAQAGAVDEETFIGSFEEVPKVQLFSGKELEDQLVKCREILVDPNTDWEKRVDVMKKIRALVVAGATSYDELQPNLRLLEYAFQLAVKDLRSQVVRETCITIAYLSQRLGHRLDHFAEALFQNLVNLIQNCAKVMATAGIVAIRFIIQFTHASRLIPILTSNLMSKSKEIRKAGFEFLDQLLHTWPTHTLERHIAILQEAIKKGISDADNEARAFARKAFWGFHEHFRDQADSLLNSLEGSKKRILQGEQGISNSSSNNSLYNTSGCGSASRSRASSAGGSTENLSRVPLYGMRKSGIPVLGGFRHDPNSLTQNGSLTPSPMRSSSAIDMNAVQRARTRQAYMAASRFKVGSGASLPRPARKVPEVHHPPTSSTVTSPERSRGRSRVGVSQSQPSSRSTSPSARLGYATYNQHMPDSASHGSPHSQARMRKVVGSNAQSTGASRETSPSRHLGYGAGITGSAQRKRLVSLGTSSDASSLGAISLKTASPQLMAHQILLQSQEAEAAMADALVCSDTERVPLRRRFDAFGNESDDSETSSVCSERSYGSSVRPYNLLNWHGLARQRLSEDPWDTVGQDVGDIIHNLSSQHWSDRKEGLLSLRAILQANRMLTQAEVKRITEIFTKMFMDSHTKVFSIFLDTLNELIITHKMDLLDWLYVLMTRLFNKLGTDLLGSIQSKIQRSMEIVRDCFAYDIQFANVMKFLSDPTQTPNLKVKLAALNHLQHLGYAMDPSEFRATPENISPFTKIVMWTTDPKSPDLRKASNAVVFAFFNLNIPEFTKLLNQLPKCHQESATKLVHTLSRSCMEGSPMKLAGHSPSRLKYPSPTVARGRGLRSLDLDDTENHNPEDIYNSLRETSNEIQNYSFDGMDRSCMKERRESKELERDTTSQDSGISQMSVADGRMDPLEEKLESSPEMSSPERKHERQNSRNGYDDRDMADYSFESDIQTITDGLLNLGMESVDEILTCLGNRHKRKEERSAAMSKLINLIKEGSNATWELHFRTVLRTLIDTLDDEDEAMRAWTLRALCELLNRHAARFQGFAELTILKVLEAHKDPDRDVVRSAEICVAAVASSLPAEQCIRVLNPIILTGDFPVNQAAIKMLTNVVDAIPHSAVMQIVPTVMPGLIKAYDNVESSVRKAAVFCMVSLHAAVGDALKPYFAELNGSKLKLLHVYIKRAQTQPGLPTSQTSSSPGSPKSVACQL